ncbi:uncharacterized protein LOC143247860 isoform X1 [Tachypleus tridentatus]|uniref:uncharacterized protein LOC143247860 isoform X1 n=1 Tax=Tachypleus tridentatus TaxID=6853 RepID=UPI003FD31334
MQDIRCKLDYLRSLPADSSTFKSVYCYAYDFARKIKTKQVRMWTQPGICSNCYWVKTGLYTACSNSSFSSPSTKLSTKTSGVTSSSSVALFNLICQTTMRMVL